jgi:uncharacterized protein (DUF1684 family)
VSQPHATADLWDYRRRVADLYAAVRNGAAGESDWLAWRKERDRLFAHHPQSPLDAAQKVTFDGIPYFPYDPGWRLETELEPVDPAEAELAHSGQGSTPFRRFGIARLEAAGQTLELSFFWLQSYGGGVFVPFRDETNGSETYGGGRYLLDTAKGADLGHSGTKVVLDFNYAYHPSCAHNGAWSCPLAPPENRLPIPVRAGERSG